MFSFHQNFCARSDSNCTLCSARCWCKAQHCCLEIRRCRLEFCLAQEIWSQLNIPLTTYNELRLEIRSSPFPVYGALFNQPPLLRALSLFTLQHRRKGLPSSGTLAAVRFPLGNVSRWLIAYPTAAKGKCNGKSSWEISLLHFEN